MRHREDAVREPGPAPPATIVELVAALEDMVERTSRWSETLARFREPTRRLAGPGAAVSLDVACRRAEQSLVELEIALGDARAAGVPG
ncbi:hypothetical protein F0L68_17165 [Solihabitans fulvus]|uniref:Uncharacterized protein n=1 Tax=Solihabitans fulvus TaxID=1892852 RepID=A0A5B2XEC7_9PSEU|nr:hypothetical protein [Solihabitans fulvus]KAA2261504.1 hypothetical protein F0L68_17165 [Solihabitans fulvus]